MARKAKAEAPRDRTSGSLANRWLPVEATMHGVAQPGYIEALDKPARLVLSHELGRLRSRPGMMADLQEGPYFVVCLERTATGGGTAGFYLLHAAQIRYQGKALYRRRPPAAPPPARPAEAPSRVAPRPPQRGGFPPPPPPPPKRVAPTPPPPPRRKPTPPPQPGRKRTDGDT